MSATEACAPCAVLGGPTSTTAPALLNGTFLRREADAQKFQEYCDGLGEECPLMPTRNSVKDKGKGTRGELRAGQRRACQVWWPPVRPVLRANEASIPRTSCGGG